MRKLGIALGVVALLFTCRAVIAPSAAGYLDLVGGTVPSASASGHARLYFDSTSNTVQASQNASSYFNLTIDHNAYKPSDESQTSNTTLTNDSALTVNVDAGKKYRIFARLFMNEINSGMKIALSGTSTVDTLKADISIWDNQSRANGIVTSYGSAVTHATTGGGAHYVSIDGTLITTNGGTLVVQWAQNASDPQALTMQKGSDIWVEPIP